MNDLENHNHKEQIYKYIIEGHSNDDILEYLEASNMTLDQAKILFEEALKSFVKAANLPKSVRLGWCLEAYRDLYRRLLETGDYSGALKAIQEISKLSVLNKKESSPHDKNDIKDEIDNYIDTVMALK